MNTITKDEYDLMVRLGSEMSSRMPGGTRVSPPVGAAELRVLSTYYDLDNPNDLQAWCRILFQRFIAARKQMALRHASSKHLTRTASGFEAYLDDWKWKKLRPDNKMGLETLDEEVLCWIQCMQKLYQMTWKQTLTERLEQLKREGRDVDMTKLPPEYTNQAAWKRDMWKVFKQRCTIAGIEKFAGEGEFGSKSLRSGWVMDAMLSGRSLDEIRVATRHASSWGVKKYLRMMERRRKTFYRDVLSGKRRYRGDDE